MKKLQLKFAKIIMTVITASFLILPGLALAQAGTDAPPPANPDTTTGTSGGSAGNAPQNVDAAVTADELLYRFNYTNAGTTGTKIGAVNALPKSDWKKTLAEVIKMLLNITGGLTLLAMTIGGAMMVFSSGSGNLLDQGKKITIAAIEGLVIIAVSYALVIGVSELQFIAPGAPATDSDSQSEQTTPPAEAAIGETTTN